MDNEEAAVGVVDRIVRMEMDLNEEGQMVPFYLIKWKGIPVRDYPRSKDWLLAAALEEGSLDMLVEFEKADLSAAMERYPDVGLGVLCPRRRKPSAKRPRHK